MGPDRIFGKQHIMNVIYISQFVFCIQTLTAGNQQRIFSSDQCRNCSLTFDKNKAATVNCSSRSFHRVPLCNVTNLRAIYLEDNNIARIKRNAFDGMHSLEEIYLDNNKLLSIENDAFSNLFKLKSLSLAGIGSKTVINKNAFMGLSDLEYLNLCWSTIQKDSIASISSVVSLEKLQINLYDDYTFGEEFKNLSNLRFLEICNSMTFTNSTFLALQDVQLRYLHLRVDAIENGTFYPLKYLKGLKVSGDENIVYILGTLSAFHNREFEYLRLVYNFGFGFRSPTFLTKYSVRFLANICTKELDLSQNSIFDIDHSAIYSLKYRACIKKLILSHNELQRPFLTELAGFPSLQYLEVCCNKYRDKRSLLLPGQQSRERHIRAPYRINNDLQIFVSKYLEFINVSYLYVSDAPNLTIIHGENIKVIDIAFNDIDCTTLFGGIPNLQVFNISHWNCGKLIPSLLHNYKNLKYFVAENVQFDIGSLHDPKGILFKGLTKLEHINLADNRLNSLHPDLFKDQSHSLKTLILNRNNFVKINITISFLHNLTLLDLSHNKIVTISLNDRKKLEKLAGKINTFQIFLKGNPLECSCNSLDFVEWLRKYRSIIANPESIKCMSGHDGWKNLKDVLYFLHDIEMACVAIFWLKFSISGIATMITVMILTVIAYRNKLAIEFFCLRIRWIMDWRKPFNENYIYDAFIAHSHKDWEWVIGDLVIFLEATLNLRVVFYERDFIPGIPLADQIAEVVIQSRKIIFVITRNFLESDWLNYELEQSRLHMFNKYPEHNIVIILKDDIALQDLPSIFETLRPRTVFLSYPINQENQCEMTGEYTAKINVFWEKLKRIFSSHSNPLYPESTMRTTPPHTEFTIDDTNTS